MPRSYPMLMLVLVLPLAPAFFPAGRGISRLAMIAGKKSPRNRIQPSSAPLRPRTSPAQNSTGESSSFLDMSADDVRKLDTAELCQWLRTLLTDNQWENAEPVIREEVIEGLNFLNFTEDTWRSLGLKVGVANSLSQIAQKVLRTEATTVAREKGGEVFSLVPAIDMYAIHDILDFLVSHMRDPSKFNCMPHVLSETSRSFALSGRNEALNSTANAFRDLSMPIETTDRTRRKIPVCSGLSGLGKTRMLEEWERIFDLAQIPPPRLGALVLYYNGHMPQPIESRMPIEASFSWRLFHRLFLERNGPAFSDFMSTMLPNNAMNLKLRTTLEVIRSHLIARGDVHESECLHLFLGIDEYQSIRDVNAEPRSKDGGLLKDLLNTLGDILSDPIDGIRLYPMFAGTDFSVMSIASSSKTETTRIPMRLLSAVEVEEAVAALLQGAVLLGYSPIRHHLFYFGGVARWATQYVELLLKRMDMSQSSEVPSIHDIESAFGQIRQDYVDKWRTSITESNLLNTSDLLYLAAYSISGRSVGVGSFRDKVSWNRLRDSSVCVIDDYGRVSVPYALFHLIADLTPSDVQMEEEQAFIITLQSLIDKVDAMVYAIGSWKLWEAFGAHFHALRINALLILGQKRVSLRDLFKGALINGCERFVRLKPMHVIETEDKINEKLVPKVGTKGHSNDKKNWRRDGWVALNDEGGDIFFSLEMANGSGSVVITDQRKRDTKALGASKLNKLVESARITPSTVVCLFSCLSSTHLRPEDIPNDSCVVSYAQTRAYHGSLWVHPAASPCVNLNLDSI